MSRRVRRHGISISLFPFLAVLICIMGALVVLLVLMVARVGPEAEAIAAAHAADATQNQKMRLEQLEDTQWRRDLLEKSRGEKVEELAQSRAKLAHLEEHTQRLQDQARKLLDRARQIDEGDRLREDQLASARQEIGRLQDEIGRKKEGIETTRRKAADQEQWYALIPYEGPHGTRRRPIYIECTQRGVILQPEGLVLGPEDFSGPLGPGNPLDAALRTISEHIQKTTGGKAGQPYPLLVVRPSGVVAYGYARSALRNWDDEFGYELIGEEKKLTFGAPDPALATDLERSVATARRRQATMVVMMPRRHLPEDAVTSFAPDSVSGLGAAGSSSPGRGVGVGGGGSGTGMPGGTGPGLGDPMTGGDGYAGPGAGGGRGSGRSPSAGAMPGSVGGDATPGDISFGAFGGTQGRGGGWGAATGEAPFSSGGQGGGSTGGLGAAPAANGSAGAAGGAGPYGQTTGALSGQGGSPARGQAAGPYSGQGGAAAGGEGGGASNGQPGGTSVAGLQFGSPRPGGAGAAGSGKLGRGSGGSGGGGGRGGGRGGNWGLPGANGRTTAVTRPVHVAVLADRIIILPEKGDDRPPQHLMIAPELTPDDVSHFVTAMQREIKGWGLAVADGYWKPVLQVEVAPDAERHFANLQTALSGSGFEIERKSP